MSELLALRAEVERLTREREDYRERRANELENAKAIGEARFDAALAEVERLRQAHWDGRAIGGFDNDGDPTPHAVVSDFAALILDDWKQTRQDADEVDAEDAATEAEHWATLARVAELEAALHGAGVVLTGIAYSVKWELAPGVLAEVRRAAEQARLALAPRSERREGDALDQAYRWILLHGIDGNRDGACAECYPGSDIPPAFAGFRCAWHHAQVACAPPAAPKEE